MRFWEWRTESKLAVVRWKRTLRTNYAYYPRNTADTGGLFQQILTQTSGGTPTTYQDLRYTQYDRSGNIRTIQDYMTGAPQIQSFDYDNLDRLTSGGASGGGQGNFGAEHRLPILLQALV